MQTIKNKRLLLLLIALSAITLLAYIFTRSDGQLSLDKKMFAAADQTKIDRVVMESFRGKVKISYDGTAWKVNTKYVADRQLVKVLFATLLQVVPKRPSNEKVKDSISIFLKKNGTHVSLYEGNELIKSFYAGANADRTQTYFQQGNDLPYLVTIPGYRVDASQVFELDENGWRDKRVFNFNWRNLKNINITYPQDSRRDFKIDLLQNLLSIQDVAIADTTRLSNFVDDLYTLAGDQLITKGKNESIDSLFNQEISFHVNVTDIAGRKFSLNVLQRKKGKNQIAGMLNDSIPMLFEKTKIFRIAKSKDFFKKQN